MAIKSHSKVIIQPNHNTMEDPKIEVLLKENQNMRTEMAMVLKNIHNCLFSFIGTLALFAGLLLSLDKSHIPAYKENAGTLAFVISQIGIIIIVFAINLQADVATKAAYIGYMEQKINTLVGENIIFWDSRVTADRHSKGVTIGSQLILFLFYFIAFLYLTIDTYGKVQDPIFLCIQVGELVTISILTLQLQYESSRTSKYINNLVSNNIDSGQPFKKEIKASLLIPLVTFVSGIVYFSIFALSTNSFCFYSAVDISILKSPTLYIGDAIFIPMFNYFLFELYQKTKDEINYKKYGKSFKTFLLLAALFSFAICYWQHIAWTKDQYTGFIDLKPGVLSAGGWWHFIFSSIEMTIMLLLLWIFAIIILEKNRKGLALSKKLFWIFFLYSSLSILDFIIKERFVIKESNLLNGFLNNLLDMKVFYVGTLLLIVYYIFRNVVFNRIDSGQEHPA